MALITCPDCSNQVSDSAPSCPKCGRPVTKPLLQRNVGCGTIVLVIAGLIILANVVRVMQGPTSHSSNSGGDSAAPPPAPTSPPLELLSFNCGKEYGYVQVEGEVKNISSDPMKNVEAVGGFRDRDGKLVTSSDALISYNRILPGQTSPFKAMHTDNPAITSCTVSFKGLFGAEIRYKNSAR